MSIFHNSPLGINQLTPKHIMTDPILFLAFGFGSGLAKKAPGTMGTLAAIPLYLLFALVFLALSFFGGHPEVAFALVTGLYGVIWWCGAFGLGITLPLALVARKKSMNSPRLSVVLYSLLAGGLLLRLILVIAGQVETGCAIYGLL